MFVEILTYLAVGGVLITLGLLVWKKQMVKVLHDYHYKNVKEEDLPAYTRQMGIGQTIIGIGLCVTGLLRIFTDKAVAWSGLIAGLVIGVAVLHKAQMKYNGGWFS